MKKAYIFLFFIFLCLEINAQSPYHINWQRELAYLGTGSILAGSGYLQYVQVEGLQANELYLLHRNNISGFDRGATYNHSPVAAEWSDGLSMGSLVLPVFFVANGKMRNDFFDIGLLYGEVILLNKGLTLLAKTSILRPRPFVYNDAFEEGNKTKPSARLSFFSGHTSTTSANCFFAAKVFSDYFPDSKLKPYVWTLAATIPAATGYFRVEAGKHYPSDVITGYAVGAAIGFLIPHLHKRPSKKVKVDFYPGVAGSTLVLKF